MRKMCFKNIVFCPKSLHLRAQANEDATHFCLWSIVIPNRFAESVPFELSGSLISSIKFSEGYTFPYEAFFFFLFSCSIITLLFLYSDFQCYLQFAERLEDILQTSQDGCATYDERNQERGFRKYSVSR